MDAASTDALIDEAVKKSGLIWVQAKLPRGVTKVAAQPVWHVQFAAADLFGAGDHTVTVELWAHYLTPIEEDPS